MKRTTVLILAMVLLMGALLSTGCFGKGGGGTTAAVTAPVSTGNIVAQSVNAAKNPDGTVTVSWKTASPSMGNHVLAAGLHFENHPLYDIVVAETATVPATEHSVILTDLPRTDKVSFAVTDGAKNIDDNGGFGYTAK